MLLLILLSTTLAAQSHFDVATVKRAAPPEGETYNINLGTTSHGTVTLSNTTLADSLRFAYQIPSDQQIAGPAWIKDKTFHYVIVGKAAPDTPREALFPMLQALLAERFQMKVHREKRELSYYALAESKKGRKIEPAKEPTPSQQSIGIDHISSSAMSMYTVCVLLARFELPGSIIVDETELKGLWGVKLQWTPSRLGNPSVTGSSDAAGGPSIFTAVKEQLGLTLESKKGLVEVLVVDQAEKDPVEN